MFDLACTGAPQHETQRWYMPTFNSLSVVDSKWHLPVVRQCTPSHFFFFCKHQVTVMDATKPKPRVCLQVPKWMTGNKKPRFNNLPAKPPKEREREFHLSLVRGPSTCVRPLHYVTRMTHATRRLRTKKKIHNNVLATGYGPYM